MFGIKEEKKKENMKLIKINEVNFCEFSSKNVNEECDLCVKEILFPSMMKKS